MASKVLVPAAPFTKLQVKKSPPEQSGSSFIIGTNDAVARVAHLEHSVRFLQEQHRLMLSGLHAEIEALRERNRDLQFQLIFNKESSPKTNSPVAIEEVTETIEEASLKRDVARLELEAAAGRGEARAAEARALQLQRMVDAQAEKLRELELKSSVWAGSTAGLAGVAGVAGMAARMEEGAEETRAELRARLADAERLVRRLRGDAERQRRELQCMKNSLHASLRVSGLDYGYQNSYHFPQVAPDFWREPQRDDFVVAGTAARGAGRSSRRPLTLPELAGQQIHRSTVYANHHTRPRNGYEHKNNKKGQAPGDSACANTPDEPTEHPRLSVLPNDRDKTNSITMFPELKFVVTKIIPHDMEHPRLSVLPNDRDKTNSITMFPELKFVVTKIIPHDMVNAAAAPDGASRSRPRRQHHRKHATDHT